MELILSLDGGTFQPDSTSDGIEYFVADVELGNPIKVYRIIWLFEGESLEVIGVVNAYRRNNKKGE
jgi:hypothetical protein